MQVRGPRAGRMAVQGSVRAAISVGGPAQRPLNLLFGAG
jgi:hypothetical protein